MLNNQESPWSPGVVLDFPVPLESVTDVRSTLLTSSLASLRERGLFKRYDAAQRSPHRDAILNCVAGAWLPLVVGAAHYQACESLGLTPDEQIDIGKDVSKRIHDTFLGLVLRAARGVGVTPWTLLAKSNTVQHRLLHGGGNRITRVGVKSARVELSHSPLLEIPYFLYGTMGMYQAAVELLASNVSVRLLRAESSRPGRMAVLRLDWA